MGQSEERFSGIREGNYNITSISFGDNLTTYKLMKEGETIQTFFSRVFGIINQIKSCRDTIQEQKKKKFNEIFFEGGYEKIFFPKIVKKWF